ncbi:macro domain-containing protein [Sporobolomyces salmoneus]|uniref:macro domain-containing protein n=1 Tax=Sporobolomyces salmoneus TaxID=183962 RepID=UPI003182A4BA
MTTKRSVSPEPLTEENNNKQPRTESTEEEGPAPPPSAEITQPTTETPDDVLAPVSDDAEIQDAPPVEPTPEESAAEEKGKEVEEPPLVQRGTGIKVEELDNIKVEYEQGTRLVGWPEDEQDEVLYPFDAKLNEKVYIWKGDITTLEVDCIVNAANKSLLGGGGVDGAIHSAAGKSLLLECAELKGAATGETKLTSGHRLPALKIAHTVGPIYSRQKKRESEELLRSCYRGTLDLCVENGLKSVAFSGISTGVYGYPIEDAARVACDEVRKFLESDKGEKIDQVIFCNFRPVDVASYVDNLPSYFPPPPPSAEPAPAASTSNEGETTEPSTGEGAEQEGSGPATDKRPDDVDEPMNSAEEPNAAPEGSKGEEGKDSTSEGKGKVPEGRASRRKSGKHTHGGGAAPPAA